LDDVVNPAVEGILYLTSVESSLILDRAPKMLSAFGCTDASVDLESSSEPPLHVLYVDVSPLLELPLQST
jgi:hypothetical protein